MHPYLSDQVAAYPVALLLAVLGAAVVALAALRRTGVAARPALGLLLLLAVGAVVGAKLCSRWVDGTADWSFPTGLTQGYRYPGAVLGLAVVLVTAGRPLCRRVPLLALGDALMPAVGVGAALLRFGCLAAGCCFGTPSALPWAIAFPAYSPAWLAQVRAGLISAEAQLTLPVHPLQIYFMLVSVAAAALAVWMERQKTYAGQVLLVFLAVDQLGKFGLEYLRQERLPGVQIASLVIGLAAVMTLAVVAVRLRAMRANHRRAEWNDVVPST